MVANVVALAVNFDSSKGPQTTFTILACVLLTAMAYGMWHARYWAVLGMQTLLGITVLLASLGLISAVEPVGRAAAGADHRQPPARCSGSWSRRWPGSRCPSGRAPAASRPRVEQAVGQHQRHHPLAARDGAPPRPLALDRDAREVQQHGHQLVRVHERVGRAAVGPAAAARELGVAAIGDLDDVVERGHCPIVSLEMAETKYDCIVIGTGPGGYVAAIRAAQLGMKTAVVEKADTVGGRCLNEACIPAKAVLRVADAMKEVQGAKSFGITTGDVSFDFGGATKHRDKVIKTLTGGVAMLFKKNGIDVIEGHGAVTDDGNVKVGGSFDGSEIEAGKVILATGSIARPVGGLEFGGRIVDTAKMWLTAEQPKRLAVIGAGASGTEVASAFGRLGTDVILLEALDQILPLEEPEIAKATAKEIGKQNVKIITGANVENVDDSGDSVKIDVRRRDPRGRPGRASPPGAAPTWRAWAWTTPASRPTTAA